MEKIIGIVLYNLLYNSILETILFRNLQNILLLYLKSTYFYSNGYYRYYLYFQFYDRCYNCYSYHHLEKVEM